MPVIRRDDTLPGTIPERLELQTLLAEELRKTGDASPAGDPVILEQKLGATGRWSVSVIWSRWNGLRPDERAEVVRSAYRGGRPDGPTEDRIVIAEGLDWHDPRVELLLPYSVVPAVRGGEASDEQVKAALLDNGAFEVQGRPVLRLPTEDAAFQAADRLNARLPAARWVVTQTVPVPDIRF